MPPIGSADDRLSIDPLAVRAPRQRRTREQWNRVLDVGVQILEEGGYESFTIAAVCQRAGVPPRALYARTPTKDGLFLAVYEHGMQRVLASQAVFTEPGEWAQIRDRRERVQKAVRAVIAIFAAHAGFLRSIVLVSSAHPEVRRRGERYRQQLSGLFTAVLSPDNRSQEDRESLTAREFCFDLIFSTLVVRTAYGPELGSDRSDEELARAMATMANRYLLT